MKIKIPNQKDYKEIADIHNRASEVFEHIYSQEEKEAFEDSLIETEKSIAELSQTRKLLVIQENKNHIVGYGAFRKKNNFTVWISCFYIDPREQGKGYGGELLKEIEKYALKEGCAMVALETHRDATWAINFYMKNDYKIINDNIHEFPYSKILEKPPVPNRPVIAKLLL